MSYESEDFIGAWDLVDWRIEYASGKVTRPFGEEAYGYLVYSADGIMSASIAAAGRMRLAQHNAREASVEAKGTAFDSYFHYAGTWRIDGEDVVHSITMSLNPDMKGTDHRRRAKFDGQGGLVLSATEPLKSGESRHHILQWKRR